MAQQLSATATNTTGILSVTISMAHNSPSATAVITATNSTLMVGDYVEIYLGYDGSPMKLFDGYVKILEKSAPNWQYVITCNDKLIKAIDYFIASDTPDQKYTARNISAEDLVEDMLNLASISSGDYTHGTSYFSFGITRDVEVNLMSAYDMCKVVADVIAWHIWAASDGTIHFEDRRPYVMDTDTPQKTLDDTDLTKISHRKSDRDLRNRIVVYGAEGINATAEEDSPYLPSGFRKSVVVASPYIDDQTMAQNAADWNLDKLNRLTEELSVEIVGDPSIHARHILTIANTYTGTSGDWYVYSCEHKFGREGYTTGMELRK